MLIFEEKNWSNLIGMSKKGPLEKEARCNSFFFAPKLITKSTFTSPNHCSVTHYNILRRVGTTQTKPGSVLADWRRRKSNNHSSQTLVNQHPLKSRHFTDFHREHRHDRRISVAVHQKPVFAKCFSEDARITRELVDLLFTFGRIEKDGQQNMKVII